MDLVPTDIAAGLMLVLQQQTNAEESLYEVRIVNPSSVRALHGGAGDSARLSQEMACGLPKPKIWMTVSFLFI